MKYLLPLLCFAAGPVLAADGKITLPAGCTAYVTVQHSDCQVSYHYSCESDPEGDQWAVYAGADGPYYMSRIDAETRWIESHDLIAPESDKLGEEKNPASFTTLLETGRDDFDFSTISSSGEKRHYVGYDHLTGKKVTIDGQSFDQTEFKVEAFDAEGKRLHTRTGNQLISRAWRLFFADSDHFENSYGDVEDTVSRPVTFAFPDDPGFLTKRPQFGCDMMTTQAEGGPVQASFEPEVAP